MEPNRQSIFRPTVGSGKRRRAFALGETVVLLFVVMITFGGIFSSMGASMRMRSNAQVDLNSYLVAQSLFEALGSTNPNDITDQASLVTAVESAAQKLGGKKVGGRIMIRSYQMEPVYEGETDGCKLVTIKVHTPKDLGNERILTFSRGLNSFRSDPVPDRAYRRQL